jgi:DNA polymerase I
VKTIFGRLVHIPDMVSHDRVLRRKAENLAINASIQDAAADLMRRAMVRMPTVVN